MRPSTERITAVIQATIMEHRLNIHWHSIGRLLDKLAVRGDCDDVIAWICVTMHGHERLNRSAFIRAFFEFLRETDLIVTMDYANLSKRNTTRREPERPAGPKKRKKTVR